MTKAILVIDKPEKCEKCPLYAEYLCDKKARCSITYIPIDSAYANCPLKPMLEKLEIPQQADISSEWFRRGYNRCVTEILEMSEKEEEE